MNLHSSRSHAIFIVTVECSEVSSVMSLDVFLLFKKYIYFATSCTSKKYLFTLRFLFSIIFRVIEV